MPLPESHILSFLNIERSPTYPTYFHPTSAVEILKWQDKIKLATRPVLFSFAGAQRPSRSRNGLVRTQVILQCKSSFKNCRFLDCDVKANSCDDPISLMKLFESSLIGSCWACEIGSLHSVFCLQLSGDSLTRRSIFDSMVGNCHESFIFFNLGSAYKQSIWHIPSNYSKHFTPKKKTIANIRFIYRLKS
ncbi:unnamed protein product [Brassica oleracea var. botrytis]